MKFTNKKETLMFGSAVLSAVSGICLFIASRKDARKIKARQKGLEKKMLLQMNINDTFSSLIDDNRDEIIALYEHMDMLGMMIEEEEINGICTDTQGFEQGQDETGV